MSKTISLLCEGYDPALVPQVAYVQQGDKVCFVRGVASMLSESVGDNLQIVESVDKLELVERNGRKVVKDGRWVVEGPYQRSGVKNANGRVYSRRIWERILGDKKGKVNSALSKGGLPGHNEHPKDGRTDLNEHSLATISLKLMEDGVVWGRSKILDTPKGQILSALLSEGVQWGVSSRGNGSVDSKGNVDEETFDLITFDAVSSPSTPGAFPAPVKEEDDLDEELLSMTDEDLNEADTDLISRFIKAVGRRAKDEESTTLLSKLKFVMDRYRSKAGNTGVNESADINKARSAFKRIVTDLQRRIANVTTTVESLTKKLDNRNAVILSLSRKRGNAVREAQKIQRESAQRLEEITRLRKRVVTAEAVIADISAKSGVSVEESVDAVVEEHPSLSRHRALLGRAQSHAELREMVDDLLPVVSEADTSVRVAVRPTARPILPQGHVVSESFTPQLRESTEHYGAGLAAAVVRKTK